MKVMMLTYGFDPCPQSSSQRVSSFARAMVQSGFEVTVITASRCLKKKQRRPSSQICKVYDLKCSRSAISLSNLTINPLLVLLFSFMGILLLSRRRASVLLASVPYGDVAIAGFFLSKIFGVPLVIDMRDLYPSTPELSQTYLRLPRRASEFLTNLFLMIYKSSSKIVCVDSNIKEKLNKLGVATGKVFVVPNGAEASVYKPCKLKEREEIRLKYGLPLGAMIFVYAGTLTRYYPVMEAITGVREILSSGTDSLQLLIISYTSSALYRDLTKDLGLEKTVRFMGPLSIPETARVLSACDVGIVPYGCEDYWKGTYGSKIFSYLSCGLPILASGPPGSVINDMISRYDMGFFVGKPYPENFAKGFSFFLNNQENAKKFGENARKIVEKSYDREKLALSFAASLRDTHERRSNTNPF